MKFEHFLKTEEILATDVNRFGISYLLSYVLASETRALALIYPHFDEP